MYYLAGEVGREGRKLIVFVDEFRGTHESVRQTLEVEANDVGTLGFEWEKLIYLTGDATAYELASQIGSKVGWFLIWNLPKEDFEKLYMQTNPPENISYDLVWKLIGGNPRELILLWKTYEWNIEEYINYKVRELSEYLARYFKNKKVDFTEIEELVEDIEGAKYKPLWDFLLKRNVVVNTAFFMQLTSPPREPWIAETTAYQVPIHYWIMKAMAKEKTLTPKPEQILKVLS